MKSKYDEEFRAEALNLALTSGKTKAEIARDLGINYKTSLISLEAKQKSQFIN